MPIESQTRKDQFGRPEIEAVRLEIEPEEAKWVRKIFEWFADGHSPRWIARELNRSGVPSSGDKTWAGSAIYGSNKRGRGLLNNEIYIGKRIWNRTEWIKDPDTGKRTYRASSPRAGCWKPSNRTYSRPRVWNCSRRRFGGS